MKHWKALSSSVDEYLEEMYRCELCGESITTKGLAARLKVSMPSVSEMLPKLRKMGFVSHRSRGTTELTGRGRMLGRKVYDKHETIKRFLLSIGLAEASATKEACRLEHGINDGTLKRLRAFLNKPVCPRCAALSKGVYS